MPDRKWWLLVGVLALQAGAWATSFDGYGVESTPFAPPAGFLWVPVLFCLLFTIANGVFLRRVFVMSWWTALIVAGCTGVGMALMASLSMTGLHMGQVSSLAWGSPVFWGFGWREVGDDFVVTNLFTLLPVLAGASCLAFTLPVSEENTFGNVKGCGLLVLAIGVILIGGGIAYPYPTPLLTLGLLAGLLLIGGVQAFRRFREKVLALVVLNLLVYAVCLTPYLATGAYTHGLAPWMHCSSDFTNIGFPLQEYVRTHHGRLPAGRTLPEVLEELYPSIPGDDLDKETFITQLCSCNAGYYLERQPRPRTWNAALAGATMDDLRQLPTPVMLVSCPYHPRYYIDSADLLRAWDDPEHNSLSGQHF